MKTCKICGKIFKDRKLSIRERNSFLHIYDNNVCSFMCEAVCEVETEEKERSGKNEWQ